MKALPQEAELLTGPACQTCNGTGIVPGTRLSYEAGVWVDVPTKYRMTCPACHGGRHEPAQGGAR